MSPCQRDGRESGLSPDPSSLRWSLLFVACEVADPKSADFLLRTARQRERPTNPDGTAREGTELLMRLLAVKALHRIARRHQDVRRHLLDLILSRPEPAVLLEALAAAEDLGLEPKTPSDA